MRTPGKSMAITLWGDDVKEEILSLCAEGLLDEEVAKTVREKDLLPRVTADDIKRFRRENRTLVCEWIDRNLKIIAGRTIRAKKPYRIAELNNLLGMIYERIPELLIEAPGQAVRLMEAYLKGLRQLAEETGDMSKDIGQTNTFIIFLQRPDVPTERKARVTRLLQELHREVEGAEEPPVIEAEFSATEPETN